MAATASLLDRQAAQAGRKSALLAAGTRAASSLVFLAGSTIVARQDVASITDPDNSGAIDIALSAATAIATGTITSAELRDRNDAARRTFATVGAAGSGRDLEFSVTAGAGLSVDGSSNIVVSATGVTFDAWVLRQTQPA